MAKTAKHRLEYKLLRYPIMWYIRHARNNWEYFQKPALKKRTQNLWR